MCLGEGLNENCNQKVGNNDSNVWLSYLSVPNFYLRCFKSDYYAVKNKVGLLIEYINNTTSPIMILLIPIPMPIPRMTPIPIPIPILILIPIPIQIPIQIPILIPIHYGTI